MRAAAPRKTTTQAANVAVKLGRRLGFWRSPVVIGVVAVMLAAFAVDAGVGWYQARAPEEARQARLLLENTAMRSLYVELKQIAYEPDGKSFRMTLFLQNTSPAGPLYVMLNAVGVYVQSGMNWLQVPSRPAEGVTWGVVKLVDGYSYDVIFTPDVANWAELIPGYMHVRIQSDLLVSEKAQPGNDVVERRTPLLCLPETAWRQRRGHQGPVAHVWRPADLSFRCRRTDGGTPPRLLLSACLLGDARQALAPRQLGPYGGRLHAGRRPQGQQVMEHVGAFAGQLGLSPRMPSINASTASSPSFLAICWRPRLNRRAV